MRVIIRPTYDEVSQWVAQYIKTRILAWKPTEDRPFVLGLPTGSSPIGTYKALVQMYKAGELSFKHVITFNMDEYVDLPRDHPESYHSFMWNNLFKHVDIQPRNVHILDGNAPDLKAECKKYEDEIKRVGGIELFLGGIGTDGHIAFNEPGSALSSRTRVKTLAYETIVANARFFGGDITKVPKMALTVGVQTIMEAREVVIVVSGQSKAAALEKCIEQGVNHMYTLSAIQLHQCSCIVCDDDATGELRVRTVRYFKGLEKVHMELLGHKDFGGVKGEPREQHDGAAGGGSGGGSGGKEGKEGKDGKGGSGGSGSGGAGAAGGKGVDGKLVQAILDRQTSLSLDAGVGAGAPCFEVLPSWLVPTSAIVAEDSDAAIERRQQQRQLALSASASAAAATESKSQSRQQVLGKRSTESEEAPQFEEQPQATKRAKLDTQAESSQASGQFVLAH